MPNNDPELIELRKKKDELILKVQDLKYKLEQRQNLASNFNLIDKKKKIHLSEDVRILEELSQNRTHNQHLSTNFNDEERFVVRLVDATQQATGISFQDVEKKWLRDDIWHYAAEVVMKIFTFHFNLTVDMKDGKETEILDINCNFVKIIDCYLQEIRPWVEDFTRDKKMNDLMSAFSDYNDQCIIRQKILDKLENQKFITIEKSSTGGFIIYVDSSIAPKKQYIKFFWTTRFSPKTRSIDHSFTIDAIDNDFAEKHEELLHDFCKKGLKKEDLERLWIDLCTSVDKC